MSTRAIAIAALLCALGCQRKPSSAVDVWLGGDVHVSWRGNARLTPLREFVGGAVGIANLEGPLGDDAANSTGQRLVNDARAVNALRAEGVFLWSVANNHRLDLGAVGAQETAQELRASGFVVAGGHAGFAVVDRGGLRLGVLAIELETALLPALQKEIARRRQQVDALIVSFHTRGPGSYLPGRRLQWAVNHAEEAGAALISVHGSHVVARVERRGRAVIAWGLGNLLFDCDCSRHQEGLIVRVRLSGRGAGPAQVIPIHAGLAGLAARPATDAQLVFDLLESLGSSALTREGQRAWF